MAKKEKTEQEKQDTYNKLVFGTVLPQKEKIVAALNRAHEIRQFEIRLYWQRSFFFWGFIFAFLTAFALVLDSERIDEIKPIAAVFLSCMGWFTTFAWLHIEIGSKTWQANWEKHIDFLENNITGKLHKVNIGKPLEFFSVSEIHRTFIYSMIWFWRGLLFLSVSYTVIFFADCIKKYLSIIMMTSVNTVFSNLTIISIIVLIHLWILYLKREWLGPKGTWQEGEWRTNFVTEPPEEPIDGDKLTLRHRESPDVHFVHKPYKQSK